MPRPKRQPLRGSVTQNTSRPRRIIEARPRFGFLARLGMLLGGVLAAGLVIFLVWHSGWPQRQAEHLLDASLRATQQAHFAVKDIVVEGREQTAKEALFAALGTAAGEPILGFDPDAAQTRLAKLPWIAAATVERRLPDTIVVRLAERVPLARWQYQKRVSVIDATGKELPDARPEQFAALPLVVGADAAPEAGKLLQALQDYPAIGAAMTAAVRVGERRWDLHLAPKIIVRLPEKGLGDALKRLADLIHNQKILERDIVAVDLRMPDRMIIEPASPRPETGDTRL